VAGGRWRLYFFHSKRRQHGARSARSEPLKKN
jgi:hypothetical protein